MQHVHNLLPDYSTGKLDDSLHREVSAHLEMCAECRAEAGRVSEVLRLMEGQPHAQPPSGYFPALLPRIRESLERADRFAWLKNPFLVRFAAPLVAVVIIASLASRVSVTDPSLAESLTLDDVSDMLERHAESLPFADDNIEQFAASTVPEGTFERRIAQQLAPSSDAYSFDDLAGTSTAELLETLSEQEVKMLLQRLEERSLSL